MRRQNSKNIRRQQHHHGQTNQQTTSASPVSSQLPPGVTLTLPVQPDSSNTPTALQPAIAPVPPTSCVSRMTDIEHTDKENSKRSVTVSVTIDVQIVEPPPAAPPKTGFICIAQRFYSQS